MKIESVQVDLKMRNHQINRIIFFSLLFLLTILTLACADFFALNQKAGEEYYQRGLQQLTNGDEAAASSSFKKATLKYRRLAKAYFQLAKIYLTKDNIEGRTTADYYLREAVSFDPKNVEYRLALARLDLRREMNNAATGEFKRVLALDSTVAEAWYSLGYLHEQELLHLQNLISPDSNGATIYFTDFADKELQKSLQYYKKAIETNSSYLQAYYHLGFIYYEVKNWQEMILNFKQALQYAPEDKDCHLYLALAFHRNREYQTAYEEYQLAWQKMSDEERNFYSSVEPLLASEVKKVFDKQTKDTKIGLALAYWQSRDPLYLTDYNERLMEHFARIAYVSLRYSLPSKHIEGWQTDRGKVYIRYGPPENQTRTRAWYNLGLPVNGDPVVTSKEIWLYPGFQFIFEDRFLNRNYQFKWGTNPYDDYLDIYRRTVKKMPEYYQPDLGGSQFDIPVTAAQFARPDSQRAVYLFCGVPVRYVNRTVSNPENRAQANLQKGIFIFDESWRPVLKSKTTVLLETQLQPGAADDYFFTTDSLLLPPATYQLAVEYFDPAGKNFGRYQDTLRVPAINHHSIELSDLVLANEIKLKTAIENVNRHRITVLPNFKLTFKPGQDLYLYYEIYNLKQDANRQTNYQIAHTIRQMQEKTPLFKTLLSSLGIKKQVLPNVVTTFSYTGDRQQENHYRILQLKDYPPGLYRLKVRVEDLFSNASAEKTVWFRIQKNAG